MIKYMIGSDIDMIRLMELFNEAGWGDRAEDYHRLVNMVESSDMVITAWDFDYMVGFARLTRNESHKGQINDVVVDKEYRGQGIGQELVGQILKCDSALEYTLKADEYNKDFFESLGFEPADQAMIFRRKE